MKNLKQGNQLTSKNSRLCITNKKVLFFISRTLPPLKRNIVTLSTMITAVILLSSPKLLAQNSSPFWSLAGNSNVSSTSKLGTTNDISLRFYTNDVQRMIINSAAGYVGIGTATPVNILTVQSGGGTPAASWLNGLNSPIFMGFADNVSSEFVVAAASNTTTRRPVIQGRRSRGTLVAPSVVATNDYLTSLLASGYDGNTFQNPATIDFFVDGTPSAGNVPARISFVTGTNSANRLERLRVGSTGNFNFNDNQLTINQANGRVGLGTANPQTRLHIYDQTAVTSFTGLKNAGLRIQSFNSPNNYALLGFTGFSASYTGNLAQIGAFFTNEGSSLSFGTSNNYVNGITNTAMTIDYNGNVGVGTTDPVGYKLKISHGFFGLDIENASNGDDWELYTSNSLQLWYEKSLKGSFNSTNGAYAPISDERLKTNIKPMTTMLEKINKLRPSTYQFKNTADKQEYNGFIAQDVLKIFPSMVTHNVDKDRDLDIYTLDYNGFGVIAVKGIQELEVALKDKDQQIIQLKNELNDLKNLLVSKGLITAKELTSTPGQAMSKASLAQTVPNPSTGNTTLGYYLPEDTKTASIQIVSINGTVLKSYPVTQMGNAQLTINVKDFAAGVYVYSLVVNGNKISSRKMIIAR